MRDETKEAMRMFLGGRCYTAENLERDYLAEVAEYSDDRWEAPQRAARLAAAQRRQQFGSRGKNGRQIPARCRAALVGNSGLD